MLVSGKQKWRTCPVGRYGITEAVKTKRIECVLLVESYQLCSHPDTAGQLPDKSLFHKKTPINVCRHGEHGQQESQRM